MSSLRSHYLDTLAFSAEDLSMLATIGQYQGKQALYAEQAPEMLTALQQHAIIESSESSNRIERVVAPRARIKALVEHDTKPRDRTEQEIAGYRDALELIHEQAEHIPLSIGTTQQLHQIVYRYHPSKGGIRKATNNDIVERHPGGTVHRVRFHTVPAVSTPQAMEDFAASYHHARNDRGLEPLVLIPLAILDFLCIHPFRDGNGRVSRLLTLLLLFQAHHWVGRYLSLERVTEQSKTTYYDALERSSQGWHEGKHDVLPWLRYFWGMLLRAYAEFDERASVAGQGTKTDMIKAVVDRQIAPFAISEVEAALPHVSRDMIRLVLRQLRDEGLIESIGKGRGAKWRQRTS